ncbi:MAG: UvrY/SirA/GacA family response regulator transcription factor [Gammaproteobacteria bacterium]|uniref:UvrY/SirA/GacA family response regulator transcription factor n=1 Tax=Pseudomaricurvus alcaniphilus TaxID=1166482 RepID=UPI00140ACE7E|nr:UvrY/SirA/GacA family response regulator transcription factor [Pseudomaricurvus alcaniphilus]MBR9911508.1 UvrY/SirA/GacA family response regulator transcription factor [Gammaproteobacteria bacterium]NHN35927.1 UvrY/SirA/GacA family response regulator transcription factor [Pseudomaricurvus alcaniphilus]
MIKILIVDDHDLVRTGLVHMLSAVDGFNVVGDATCGEEAVKMTRTLKPDVVLMDVKMPGIGGIEATKKLNLADNHVKVIAVTACDDDMFPNRLLQAGAVGYVTKGAGLDEMIKAIRTVHEGNLYVSSKIAQQMALRSFNGNKSDKSPFEKLSERELQTAMLISNGKKAQEIADTFCVSPKTVNSYRYRIFEKLDINSDVELTLLAVKHNILDIENIL